MASNQNLVKCKIEDIEIGQSNIYDCCKQEIRGIVLSKYECKEIFLHKGPSKTNHVFMFLLRDSLNNYISVECWGSKNYIQKVMQIINIQDQAVKIQNPIVKPLNDKGTVQDDSYRPWTPSPYKLSVNENLSKIELLNDQESQEYEKLKNLPIREPTDYYVLEDIKSSEQILNDKYVNLLFAIREIGTPQPVITKTGENLKKLDLTIFDKTNDSFKLTIWDEELIEYAIQTWEPMFSIVFAVDLRLKYNDYIKSLAASSTSKTIFITNPHIRPAYPLFNYAKSVQLPEILPILEQLKKDAQVCTIEKFISDLNQGLMKSEYVIITAVVTKFDIDSDFSKYVSFKCKRCNIPINLALKRCANQNCKNFNHGYNKYLNLPINITDHTRTLSNVTFGLKIFEKFFDLSVEDCLNLNLDELTKLKLRLFGERFSFLIRANNKLTEKDGDEFIKYYFKLVDIEDWLN